MTSSTTAKMAHSSISVDRDALREQQRQHRARAQMMDTSNSSSNPVGLFAEPISRVGNSNDVGLQIERYFGKFESVKDVIFTNHKLVGVGMLDQTRMTRPTVNGLTSSSSSNNNNSVSGGHHHHPSNHHHSRGSSAGSGSSSSNRSSSNPRISSGSSSSVATSRNPVGNGWNSSQVKPPVENSSSCPKPKAPYKTHSPASHFALNHSSSSAASVQNNFKPESSSTAVRDQCSSLTNVDKTKSAVLNHSLASKSSSASSSSSSSLATVAPSNKIGDLPRVNGTFPNGTVKPSYGRSSVPKPPLKLNIDEAAKNNHDTKLVENILKEMIAPTPLTAIPTPCKDETKFPFSSVGNHQLAKSPSIDPHSSKSGAVRSLDRAFTAASTVPSAADKPLITKTNPENGVSLIDDLQLSESSDDEAAPPERKSLQTESRNGVRSPVQSVLTNPPPQVRPMSPTSDSTSSETDESSSASDSEPSDDEAKPASPKPPDMNWGLNNFMPTQPDIPFGLPSDTPVVDRSSSSRSNSTNKTNVCDSGSGRQQFGRTAVVHNNSDDEDARFGSMSGIVNNDCDQEDIKALIASPPKDSLKDFVRYPKKDEVTSKVKDGRSSISPPLLPISPAPHLTSSSQSLSCMTKKRSSVSPRSRSPAAALHSMSAASNTHSRESKNLVGRPVKNKTDGSSISAATKKGHIFDPKPENFPEKDLSKSKTDLKVQANKLKRKNHKLDDDQVDAKTKDKLGASRDLTGSDLSLNIDDNKSKKFSSPVTKRPHTPPGPPPPSPPPPPPFHHIPPTNSSSKTLVRQNSGSSKGVSASTMPSSTSTKSSKSSSTVSSKSSSSLSSSSKSQSKSSEKKDTSITKHKSPHHKRTSKSSPKIKSKEIISDTSDSDSDIDIGGGACSPAQASVPQSKKPTQLVGEKSNKGLGRPPHTSSTTSLSSTAESVDDVSTGTGTVLTSKSNNNRSSSGHSSSRKSKENSSSSSKSSSRDEKKSSKSSATSKSGNAASLAEEMSLNTTPLSPLGKDDFKEERSRLKTKGNTSSNAKFPSICYREGYPSLVVSLDKQLFERVPVYPPVQLRLMPDSLPSKKLEPLSKKLKTEQKRSDSPSVLKSENKISEKESSAAFNSAGENKAGLKSGKRPLPDSDAVKSESKKLKLSSKENKSSCESLAQSSLKAKPSATEKLKKEEYAAKNSPANSKSQSPTEFLDKKAKGLTSGHKNSPLRKEKKRSSSTSSSTTDKKEKSSRENDFKSETQSEKKSNHELADGKKENSLQVEYPVGSLSGNTSLTAQGLSKESKARNRDTTEASEANKRKAGAPSSSASQPSASSILTDTQKATTSEGIERNTNHDRITSANEGSSNKSSSSTSNSTDPSNSDLILKRIAELLDSRNGRGTEEYYANIAKRLKHEADNTKQTDRTFHASTTYLQAVLYFVLAGVAKERSHRLSNQLNPFFSSVTIELVKYVLSRCKPNPSTNSAVEHKLAVLSLYCLSALHAKSYDLRKNELRDCQRTIAEYQKSAVSRNVLKQMASPGQSSSTNAVPTTMWNKTNGAPSPMSPLPSPAGSVGSVESQSSGYSSSEIGQQQQQQQQSRSNSANGGSLTTGSFNGLGPGVCANSVAAVPNLAATASHSAISLPGPVYSAMQRQLELGNFLHLSYENWEQAEAVIQRHGLQEFFRGIDARYGKLNMFSSLRDMVQYVLLGLHLLGVNVFKILG